MVSADALKRSNSGKKYFFAFNPTREKGETKQQLIGWDKYRANVTSLNRLSAPWPCVLSQIAFVELYGLIWSLE